MNANQPMLLLVTLLKLRKEQNTRNTVLPPLHWMATEAHRLYRHKETLGQEKLWEQGWGVRTTGHCKGAWSQERNTQRISNNRINAWLSHYFDILCPEVSTSWIATDLHTPDLESIDTFILLMPSTMVSDPLQQSKLDQHLTDNSINPWIYSSGLNWFSFQVNKRDALGQEKIFSYWKRPTPIVKSNRQYFVSLNIMASSKNHFLWESTLCFHPQKCCFLGPMQWPA